jgi:hypothetical protein
MNRLYKFRHSYLDYIVDLGNIKFIEIGTVVSFVRIKLLKNTEYIVNPKSNDIEVLEPEINLNFSSSKKVEKFAGELSKAWEEYLEKK